MGLRLALGCFWVTLAVFGSFAVFILVSVVECLLVSLSV